MKKLKIINNSVLPYIVQFSDKAEENGGLKATKHQMESESHSNWECTFSLLHKTSGQVIVGQNNSRCRAVPSHEILYAREIASVATQQN